MSGAHTTKTRVARAARARAVAVGKKRCPKCGVTKSLESFPMKGKHRNGDQRYGYCKPCHVTYQRPLNRKSLLVRFGITEAQYQKMFEMQGGVCAICRRPPKTRRLAVEHDHKTGRVRCLACFSCNRNKIGTNTVESARRVLALLASDFDGRSIVPSAVAA